MLDAHPQLAIPPETHFVPAMVRASPRNAEEFLEVLTASPRWRDWHLDRRALKRELEHLAPFTLGDALRTFYLAYSRRFGKPRWGDKTPAYAGHIRLIEKVLPEASFIHLLRDPRDVVLSVVSANAPWWGSRNVPEAAQRWAERVRVCREQGANANRYLEIRYEDLVRSPAGVLGRLCEFLELPWAPAMLSYHARAADRMAELGPYPHPGGERMAAGDERRALHTLTGRPPLQSRIGRWRSELSVADSAQIDEVAADLLQDLGHTPEAFAT
jgi:hypothetical protein